MELLLTAATGTVALADDLVCNGTYDFVFSGTHGVVSTGIRRIGMRARRVAKPLLTTKCTCRLQTKSTPSQTSQRQTKGS